jgi:hypothetical protein
MRPHDTPGSPNASSTSAASRAAARRPGARPRHAVGLPRCGIEFRPCPCVNTSARRASARTLASAHCAGTSAPGQAAAWPRAHSQIGPLPEATRSEQGIVPDAVHAPFLALPGDATIETVAVSLRYPACRGWSHRRGNARGSAAPRALRGRQCAVGRRARNRSSLRRCSGRLALAARRRNGTCCRQSGPCQRHHRDNADRVRRARHRAQLATSAKCGPSAMGSLASSAAALARGRSQRFSAKTRPGGGPDRPQGSGDRQQAQQQRKEARRHVWTSSTDWARVSPRTHSKFDGRQALSR